MSGRRASGRRGSRTMRSFAPGPRSLDSPRSLERILINELSSQGCRGQSASGSTDRCWSAGSRRRHRRVHERHRPGRTGTGRADRQHHDLGACGVHRHDPSRVQLRDGAVRHRGGARGTRRERERLRGNALHGAQSSGRPGMRTHPTAMHPVVYAIPPVHFAPMRLIFSEPDGNDTVRVVGP
jgi:hypothetical protein